MPSTVYGHRTCRPGSTRRSRPCAPGAEFLVVTPVFRDYRAWNAKWTHLVWKKSIAYTSALQRDPRVRLLDHVTTDEIALHHNYFKLLQAFVYRRVG